MPSENEPKRILILAANPANTAWLRLDKEVKAIHKVLKLAQQGERFKVHAELAATPDDVQQTLLDYAPHIVHFCGHGDGPEGLIFEGDHGTGNFVTAEALASLFELFADQVECVLLNACYSDAQADAIVQHIDAVIGMNQAIGDKAAIKFSVGFYRGLGAGKDVEFAYKLGRNAIAMAGVKEEQTPVLRRKPKTTQLLDPPTSETTASTDIFISYHCPDLIKGIFQTFYETLSKEGYGVFTATESIRSENDWPQRLEIALEEANYLLLFLSKQSATSEMVLHEVQKAKHLRDTRPGQKPVIVPVRVNLSASHPLNHDLRHYLQRVKQREWNSETDTASLVAEVLNLIKDVQQNDLPEPEDNEQDAAVSTVETSPLPVAEPELPGGQVDLASKFYVERPPIEERCYEAIVRPGSLIRIKAPRQMGKTSLLARTLHHAETEGCIKISLSFQIADGKIFNDLDQFLKWFCASVGRRLRLPSKLSDYWDEVFGSKDNCSAYFEEYLLAELDRPLALGLDEVDLVFQHPEIASDFFGMLRAWHEDGKSRAIWKKLRLIVVHSTEVYIPLNINQSPFNVGLAIELPEFQPDQIKELAHRHGLGWQDEQVSLIQNMIGGHPYLMRVALYNLAREDMTLDELLKVAPTEAGPYGDHLRRHLWNLEQRPELAQATKQVVIADKPIRLESVQAFQLHSMGLVRLEGNDVTPRCNLYQQYFSDRLERVV